MRVRSGSAKESGTTTKGMQGKVGQGTGKWAEALKAQKCMS